jgi:16S rRNA (cytosine1402-N4)-methyltransferase
MSKYHTPIMVQEVIAGLQVTPGKRFIDATVGGAGHTAEIVKRGGIVLGIDTDKEAVEEARRIIDGKMVQGNFRDIESIAKKNGFESVDGILFDLGVSSHQLDTAGRGFSYRFPDAPLDLRLNQQEGKTAADYLQTVTENELYEILATFGEEEHSRAIASAIVRTRRVSPVKTTGDLLNSIDKRAASQVFQALRIVINDELNALKEGLHGAKELIKPGGRLAVISFHSLEDRIVKLYLKTDAWKLITKKPVVAGENEVQGNKRARSAKLRIAEKI